MWRSREKRPPAEAGDAGFPPLLRPERRVRRPLPANLEDGEARLFAGELERVLPPTLLRELTDVRISGDGLLYRGSRILPESFSFPCLSDQVTPALRAKLLAVNFGLKRRRRLDHVGVWITDTWSNTYFHWMIDALSRLYMVRDRVTRDPLILPRKYLDAHYVAASLEAFGVNALELVGDDEFVLCPRLLLPGHAAPSGHYDEEVIRGVREVLMRRYGDRRTGAAGTRVYISRALSPKRRIVNEDTVIATLRAYDFRVVHTEAMSLADQVRLFSTAGFVVGNHGAGLTNMLFMPRHATVLELRHRTDAVNNCFFTLAAALGLEYLFQGCSPVGPDDDPHVAHVTVDVQRLTENLDTALTH